MDRPWSDLVSKIQLLSKCSSIKEIHDFILRETRQFGVEHVFAGIIPEEGMSPEQQLEHVLLGHWPEEWANRYFAKNYLDIDPTIKFSRRSNGSIRWSNLRQTRLKVMEEARDFRLNDGLTVTQVTIDGAKVGMSYAGERITNDPHGQIHMQIVGAISLNRCIEIYRNKGRDKQPLTQLTNRETDCLLWVSQGKKNHEIAEVLGISDKTVEVHISNGMKKLRAANRTQFVANALRSGIIH